MNRRAFSQVFAAAAVPPPQSLAGSDSNPFPNLKTFTAIGKEERPFAGRKEAELMNHAGRGCLKHMWFGGDFKNYALLRIRVYVDDEREAAIDMQLGMGHGFGFQEPVAPWGNRYFGKTGEPSGIFNFYSIPFGKNVRVTAELPAGTAQNPVFWWIIRGGENLPLQIAGLRLSDSARLRLHKREEYTAARLEEFNLCETSKAGILFQTAMAAKSESFQYLEAIMRAYIDGDTQPQLLSSGLEDYFLGTYYFNRGLYHGGASGLTHINPVDSSFSAYRFHEEDPIVFHKGFRLTCRCGEQKGDKIYGPDGDPQPTTYTTYVWTYEW